MQRRAPRFGDDEPEYAPLTMDVYDHEPLPHRPIGFDLRPVKRRIRVKAISRKVAP